MAGDDDLGARGQPPHPASWTSIIPSTGSTREPSRVSCGLRSRSSSVPSRAHRRYNPSRGPRIPTEPDLRRPMQVRSLRRHPTRVRHHAARYAPARGSTTWDVKTSWASSPTPPAAIPSTGMRACAASPAIATTTCLRIREAACSTSATTPHPRRRGVYLVAGVAARPPRTGHLRVPPRTGLHHHSLHPGRCRGSHPLLRAPGREPRGLGADPHQPPAPAGQALGLLGRRVLPVGRLG